MLERLGVLIAVVSLAATAGAAGRRKTCPPSDPENLPAGTLFTLAGNPRPEGMATLLEPRDYYDGSQAGTRVVAPDQVPSGALAATCAVRAGHAEPKPGPR